MVPLESASAAGDRKAALVIGNANYSYAGRLDNPINDAVLIAQSLTDLGFEVDLRLDVKVDEWNSVLREFETELENAEVGIFYYAGHGIQFKGENYLLATNANIRDQHDVPNSGKTLQDFIATMERKVPLSMVFLDACRDNPLVSNLQKALGSASRSLGVSRGLAPVQSTQNTLVAFATKPGNVAYDGETKNSPFTEALARHIVTPNIEISTMLKRVTKDVLDMTNARQRPEIVASMDTEFYFFKESTVIDESVDMEALDRNLAASWALQNAIASGTATAFRSVIDRYTDTPSAPIARQMLKDIEADIENAVRGDRKSALAVSTETLLNRLRTVTDEEKSEEVELTPDQIETALSLDDASRIQIQRSLNMLGFEAGSPDGVFGTRTRQAIRAFQVAQKVEQTGYVDQQSLLALIKTFEETPTDFDGLWKLDVHRINLSNSRSDINNRTHLASADLRIRNGVMSVVSWRNLASQPNQNVNPFYRFRGEVGEDGLFLMSLDPDVLFGKKRVYRVSVRGKLPERVAYGSLHSFVGSKVEPEIWVRVELRRNAK